MKETGLDPRLLAAASLGRNGKVFADIGTDHAYLPVYLVESGRSPRGTASDIARGPCERAERTVKTAGLSDRIAVRRRPGLDGVEDTGAEDIYVLGMGGEMIAGIIGGSEYPKTGGVRLIMQPMTKQPELRSFLLSGGYRIVDETLVRSSGRIYQLICAEYDGIAREWTDTELVLGKINAEKGGELFYDFAAATCRRYERIVRGLVAGGRECGKEASILKELRVIIRKSRE